MCWAFQCSFIWKWMCCQWWWWRLWYVIVIKSNWIKRIQRTAYQWLCLHSWDTLLQWWCAVNWSRLFSRLSSSLLQQLLFSPLLSLLAWPRVVCALWWLKASSATVWAGSGKAVGGDESVRVSSAFWMLSWSWSERQEKVNSSNLWGVTSHKSHNKLTFHTKNLSLVFLNRAANIFICLTNQIIRLVVTTPNCYQLNKTL